MECTDGVGGVSSLPSNPPAGRGISGYGVMPKKLRCVKKIWKKFSNNGKIEFQEGDTIWDTNQGYIKT